MPTYFTPETIAKTQDLKLTIPLYQRLFEWREENIATLLDDLKHALSKEETTYHVGMLTSTHQHDVVDGQQRLTIITLLACALQNPQDPSDPWRRFLVADDNEPRLHFTSRTEDNETLKMLICGTAKPEQMPQTRLLRGYQVIQNYLESNVQDIAAFSRYVFQNLALFISYLPKEYDIRDQSRYFELMNTHGRDMQQHEILKVKLLKHLDDAPKLFALWNKLADMSGHLCQGKRQSDVTKALKGDLNTLCAFCQIDAEDTNSQPIGEIAPTSLKPEARKSQPCDSRCALDFPDLLLQVLYRFVNRQENHEDIHVGDFFKRSDMLSTFERHLPYEDGDVNKEQIAGFILELTQARVALEHCFVQLSDDEYKLRLKESDEEDDDEEDDNDNGTDSPTQCLIMLQSMLLVSSSSTTHHKWFNWLMDAIQCCEESLSAKAIFNYLKRQDDLENPLPKLDSLAYGRANRYYFWRLDLHIWLKRREIFNDTTYLNVANNYRFRRNRSIEHIAPQTPQENTSLSWNDGDEMMRDGFGNLAMISSGFDSRLSNHSYEIKREHVRSFFWNERYGSIDSLKLLLALSGRDWDKGSIEQHGKRAYGLLQESYGYQLD